MESYRIQPCAALELGCGTGNNAFWLADRGFEVKAVDLSSLAVEAARKKASLLKISVEFMVADVLSDALPEGPFGFAFDRGCLHSIDTPGNRRKFAEAVWRGLADGGIWLSLIGSTDGPKRESGPPRWSMGDIAAAVESRFEILELTTTHFDSNLPEPARAWVCVMRKRA